MQDEVNEKVVSLAIKTSKLTAEVLQKAMKALLAKGKGQLTKAPHGKITMRQLMKPGEKVSNIEITDQNIKAFDIWEKVSGRSGMKAAHNWRYGIWMRKSSSLGNEKRRNFTT